MTAMFGSGDDVIERIFDDRLHRGDDGGEGMAVISVTGQQLMAVGPHRCFIRTFFVNVHQPVISNESAA
jgi:hypothetical protein